MSRIQILVACCLAVAAMPAKSYQRMPPPVPVGIQEGHLVMDISKLLAETNDAEITRANVCRRYGSRCYETTWDIEFPPGWREPQIRLLGDYPGAVVKAVKPESVEPGGSYRMEVHFRERGWRHKQTWRYWGDEFCLLPVSGSLQLADKEACNIRRRAEDDELGAPVK